MTQSADLSKLSDALPTDTTKQYAWKPGTGWIEAAGSSTTKANFVNRVRQGLRGMGAGIAVYDPDYGVVIDHAGARDVAAQGLPFFNWLSTTVTGAGLILYDSIVQVACTGAASGVSKTSATDTTLILNTGSTATGALTLAMGYPSSLASGVYRTWPATAASKCRWALRLPVLSTAAQEYFLSAFFPIPGYNAVVVRYQFTVNSGRFTVDYDNAAGTTVTTNTTLTPVAGTIYFFFVEMDATNVVVSYCTATSAGSRTTLLTVARTGVYVSGDVGFLSLDVGKLVGATSSVVHVRDFSLEATLA